ncbi:MAG: lipoate--protein ligase [Planctomycetes bacterium]|nr:lipoate--protein ligase [Planctomycetota bacterium]
MAVDATLLNSALTHSLCSVRFYRWETPTVSLGHFQDVASLRKTPRLASLPVVRRLSGGGAIVHHHELTYSCAVPKDHALAAEPRQIYNLVHQRIIACLKELGIATRLRGTQISEKAGAFLCFGRGDDFDVVIGDVKVLGSAQRRRKGAILQHGSLILKRSEYAPDFPGLSDLSNLEILATDLQRVLPEAVGRLFATTVVPSELNLAEEADTKRLEPEFRVQDLPRQEPPDEAPS